MAIFNCQLNSHEVNHPSDSLNKSVNGIAVGNLCKPPTLTPNRGSGEEIANTLFITPSQTTQSKIPLPTHNGVKITTTPN
jgi:hypothetical protein